MKRIGVIPARGGSTRLKDKNIYPICGKPLISYTIEAVIESGCFDKIYVSTDSDVIAGVARKYPQIEIYSRQAEFSGDRVTVVTAMLDMIKNIEPHEQFAYFLPTCPFRNAEDIKQGVDMLTPEIDSVLSVCDYTEAPQLAMIQTHDGYAMPVFDNLRAGITNSKYFNQFVKPSGGFYMGWTDRILKNGNFFTGKVKGVWTPKERAVDINDLLDIKYAEAVLESLQ